MPKPLINVSIIIPAYNEEKHIKDCIESLLCQEKVEPEIIVVDNGSTDKTPAIVQKYVEKFPDKVKLVRLPHNHGPGGARNLGAKLAKHNILFFLDADMVFPPDYIFKMAKPIIEEKTISTNHGEETVNNVNNPWVKVQGQLMKPVQRHSSEAFRAIQKNVFLQHGGFDTSLNYHDDRTFYYKTGLKAEVVPDAVCFHNNPDTAAEVFRRNYWIGRTFIAVETAENGLRGLAKVAKVVSLRIVDLLALPLLLMFSLLRHAGIFPEILLTTPALIFAVSTAKMKILKANTSLENIILRTLYAPAYRILRAAGLLSGVTVSLIRGLRWRGPSPSKAQPPNPVHPEQ